MTMDELMAKARARDKPNGEDCPLCGGAVNWGRCSGLCEAVRTLAKRVHRMGPCVNHTCDEEDNCVVCDADMEHH